MVITTVSKTVILGSNPSARAITKATDQVSVDFVIEDGLGFEGQKREQVTAMLERPTNCWQQVVAAQETNPSAPAKII